MRPAAVILAAGASRRMGTPKALLDIQGETFLERMVRVMKSACDPVVVVLPPGGEAWSPSGCLVTVNPDPDRGMLSSLQCGLAALPGGAERVLFTPLDYPALQIESVAAVAAENGAPIAIPCFGGRRGHPVAISIEVVQELRQLPLDGAATPATAIRRDPDRIRHIEVDDPGVLRDIDNPAEYREFLQSLTC